MQSKNPNWGVNLRIEDLIDGIEGFKKKSSCWGLHWIVLSTFVWHVWSERNRCYKEGETKPANNVASLFVRDYLAHGDLKGPTDRG